MVSLTFGQLEAVLGYANNIAPAKEATFQSRLKQWQKMGFPEGVNVGRGARASYGAAQLYQLAFMIRLLKVGLTPERAQMVIRQAWRVFKDGIAEATQCIAIGTRHYHYLIVQLDALTDLQETNSPPGHLHVFVRHATDDMMAEFFCEAPEEFNEEERKTFETAQFIFYNTLVTSITIEVDSILKRIWGAMATLKLDTSMLAEEHRTWQAELMEKGRVEQEEAHLHHELDMIDRLKGVFAKVDPQVVAASILGIELREAENGGS